MRRRILVASLAVTTLAVVLFGVPLALAARSRYLDLELLELERAATVAIASLPPQIDDTVTVPEVEDSLDLAVYDTNGHRLAGSGPARADRAVREALAGDEHRTDSGGDLVVAVPIVDGTVVLGVVRAAEPAADTARLVRNAWLAMTGLGILAIGIAALAANELAKRLAGPVLELRDAAAELGDGDFSSRPPPSGIAEVDEVARALAATGARLGEALERERAFSGDASHQLRTPLTSLRLAIDAEATAPSADRAAFLASLGDDLDRLDATVDELLTIARADDVERGPLDVDAALERAAARARCVLRTGGRKVRVEATITRVRPHVSGAAIDHALAVLVDNAIEHGAGPVTIGAHELPGALVLSVADAGSGVEDRAVAFSGRPDRASDAGLGLTLARRLVEAEGGRLNLRDVGPNPVFEILLPAPTPPTQD